MRNVHLKAQPPFHAINLPIPSHSDQLGVSTSWCLQSYLLRLNQDGSIVLLQNPLRHVTSRKVSFLFSEITPFLPSVRIFCLGGKVMDIAPAHSVMFFLRPVLPFKLSIYLWQNWSTTSN